MEDQELKDLLKQLIVSVQALTFAVNAMTWKQQVVSVPATPYVAPNPFVSPTIPYQPVWQHDHNTCGSQTDHTKALAFNLQN